MICALIDCQVQQRYYGYFYHIFFLLLFLENQQTVSSLSIFDIIVHAFCHLCGHRLQTHLKVHLSFEPSQPLPVLMTMISHHVSLWLLALSHLHIKVRSQKVLLYLNFWIYFFSALLHDSVNRFLLTFYS